MIEIVAIGGSAGSMPVITAIIDAIPADFNFTVVIIVHRLKNVFSEMGRLLAYNRGDLNIGEPEDKEGIKKQHIYLAPQNYHLLVEEDMTFSLDYSELVNYSRPSIDVTFESIAHVFGNRALCILLSGANSDGAAGLSKVINNGGSAIVQDPDTAEYKSMPKAAININKNVSIQTPVDIVNYIQSVNK